MGECINAKCLGDGWDGLLSDQSGYCPFRTTCHELADMMVFTAPGKKSQPQKMSLGDFLTDECEWEGLFRLGPRVNAFG